MPAGTWMSPAPSSLVPAHTESSYDHDCGRIGQFRLAGGSEHKPGNWLQYQYYDSGASHVPVN
eukprot:2514086-Rhodomonas_salina.1